MKISIRNEITGEWIHTGEIDDPTEYRDILRVLRKPSMFGNRNYVIIPEHFQARFVLNGIVWHSEDMSFCEAREALQEFAEDYMYSDEALRYILDLTTGEMIEDFDRDF